MERVLTMANLKLKPSLFMPRPTVEWKLLTAVYTTLWFILGKTHYNVLLWRGVLRTANEDLQEHLVPSQLKWQQRILTPSDKLEIDELEKNDRSKAVVMLLEKLLELEKPDWHELFLKSLESHFPKVAKAMKCLAEELKGDIFANIYLQVDDDDDRNPGKA